MLPKTGNIIKQDFEITEIPSKTFQIKEESISGYVDGIEAVKQAIYCILNTERYDWIIYNWNYGVELKDLFGMPIGLAKSKIKKRIKEALMQDDRILSVDAFSFEFDQRILSASFEVRTKYGYIHFDKEVRI